MKRLILILIPIFIIGITTTFGQNPVSSKPWSVSVSYSPKFEIPRGISSAQEKYFLSFDLSVDRKIIEHFSLSSGLRFHTFNRTGTAIPSHSPTFQYSESFTFLEFPIQVNYHILEKSGRIDPFIMTSLINSYYHSVFESKLSEYNHSDIYNKYFIFWDIGIGGYLKVNSNFSIISYASMGFGLKYYNPHYTYFKTGLGIRYTLIKKVNS
jgi:hypothetical protein